MNTPKQLSRRTFLRGLRISAALPFLNPLTVLANIPSKEGPITRYPDPAVEVIDPRFQKYKIGNAVIERLWTGARWSEGPVWFGDGGYLLWSDIPNNRILRWLESTGEVSVYRKENPLTIPTDTPVTGKADLSAANMGHGALRELNTMEQLLSL